MANKYTSGKHAISTCDRCGFQYKLKRLKKQTWKRHIYNIKVCPTCWDPDHPQLLVGEVPIIDPQALLEPRPDTSYVNSGWDINNMPSGGSRTTQWGWFPIGGPTTISLTPNDLALSVTLQYQWAN